MEVVTDMGMDSDEEGMGVSSVSVTGGLRRRPRTIRESSDNESQHPSDEAFIDDDDDAFEAEEYVDSDDELELTDVRPKPKVMADKFKHLIWNNKFTLVLLVILVALLIVAGILIWDHWDWEAWVTVATLIVVIIGLAKDVADPDVVLLGGVILLMTLKIIEPEEGLEGFSDSTVFAVAVLLAMAKGIEKTGTLDLLSRYLLRQPRNVLFAQLMLLPMVGGLSGILNNTPVVAMLIPVVLKWSRRADNIPASKLLIPLSYASILGGTLTLIGTSTNLVVQGLAEDECPNLDIPFFEIAYVGFPNLGIGLVYMFIFSRWLLPADRSSGSDTYSKNPREYTVGVQIKKGSTVVNKTIEKAGLRHLPGLYIIEIQHASGEIVPAPSSDTILQENDILMFAGVLDSVDELLRLDRHLVPATKQTEKLGPSRGAGKRVLVEVVLAPYSPVVGHTVRESGFRNRYQAAIIAVHRYGTRIRQKIGDIELAGGDALLLETTRAFMDNYRSDQHFALVSELGAGVSRKFNWFKILIATASALTMVAVNAAGLLSLAAAAGAALYIMLIFGCLTVSDARSAIRPTVVITIAAAFGLANALDVTGVGETIGNNLVDLFEPLGSIGIMFAIYITTAVLSSVISNAAAVALMFAVAWPIIESGLLSQKAGIYTLMFAASAAFSTPIGYQTNLMVVGPGGYHFFDFLKFGLPLQLLIGVSSVILTWVFFDDVDNVCCESGSDCLSTG